METPPAEVMGILGLASTEGVFVIQRRGYLNGQLAKLSTTSIVAALVPDLHNQLGPEDSLYRLLTRHYDLKPKRAWVRVQLDPAPAQVAEGLGLQGAPLLYQMVGCVHTARRERPLETTTSWLRPDLLRLIVEVGQPPIAETARSSTT